jgi:glycosyltransferase involved in cell wall biosynthesis
MIPDDTGIVVIGRNEGDRLERCLHSLGDCRSGVVYVDSGSTDLSIGTARRLGALVVELEPAEPFTAARARNAGLRRLLECRPAVRFVQFVDGDCEVSAGWLEEARRMLERHPKAAVVCGRRRERFPKASIYNRLCDMEWDGPAGLVASCGGDALMRVGAVLEVGGYRASMIAGEEPELCIRLRSRQWNIIRVRAEMTAHDAAIFRFSQWWRRGVRAGHAFAESAWLHGMTQRPVARRVASIAFWAGLLPALAFALAWPTRGASLWAFAAAIGLLGLRVLAGQLRRGRSLGDGAVYSIFVLIGKGAEMCGFVRFGWAVLLRRRAGIIEYKSPRLSGTVAPESP